MIAKEIMAELANLSRRELEGVDSKLHELLELAGTGDGLPSDYALQHALSGGSLVKELIGNAARLENLQETRELRSSQTSSDTVWQNSIWNWGNIIPQRTGPPGASAVWST